MPRSSCDPCCNPAGLALLQDSWRSAQLQILCSILNALGGDPGSAINYDWELLCDPESSNPVFVRFEYSTDGTVVANTTAYNANGSPYEGTIEDLVACSGGTGGGTTFYDYEALCDPSSGAPVFVRFEYNSATGAIVGVEGFNPDGSAFGGPLVNLTWCGAPTVAAYTGEEAVLLDQTAITGVYAPVGIFTASIKKLVVTSTLDGGVYLSFDGGTTDNAYVPPSNFNSGGPPVIREFNFYELNEILVVDPEVKEAGMITTGEISFEAIN